MADSEIDQILTCINGQTAAGFPLNGTFVKASSTNTGISMISGLEAAEVICTWKQGPGKEQMDFASSPFSFASPRHVTVTFLQTFFIIM